MKKSWTKIDKKTGRFIRQYKKIKHICKCGNSFKTTENRIKDGRGKYCSKKCFLKFRKIGKGENHYKWSGDSPKYDTLHKWIAKKFGQPAKCEWCGFTSNNKRKIHWANITGIYNREKKNWNRLCAKCHWHFDRDYIKIFK